MNPFLVFLIIIVAVLIWVICSFLYKPIGRFFGRLFNDVKEAVSEETSLEEKDNKGEN
jgi:F0F1-type ATP synthase membrane subunit b/b'